MVLHLQTSSKPESIKAYYLTVNKQHGVECISVFPISEMNYNYTFFEIYHRELLVFILNIFKFSIEFQMEDFPAE